MSPGNLKTTWTDNYLTLCLSFCDTQCGRLLYWTKFSISIDVQTFVSSYCRIILPHTKALYITTNETLRGIIDDVRLSLLILAYHRQSWNGIRKSNRLAFYLIFIHLIPGNFSCISSINHNNIIRQWQTPRTN